MKTINYRIAGNGLLFETLKIDGHSLVSLIQTNRGNLEFLNGGKSQPRCETEMSGSCSHARSYEHYVGY